MKGGRQAKILELISKHEINTQGELTKRLREEGYDATQATVSRDIKELNLIKLQVNGKLRYAEAVNMENSGYSSRLKSIFKDSVLSFDRAQNIVVLKTMPGLAQAAASAVDGMKIDTLAGVVAGDDTAFLLFYDNDEAEAFIHETQKMFI